MNVLKIEIADSVADAPNWNRDHVDVRAAGLSKAVIVRGGTTSGKSTVDLVFTAADGATFVAMTTGAILQQLAAAIRGAEERPPWPKK